MSDSMRPRILVLHGALGSADQMQPVVDALSEVGDAAAVEFPGHGRTKLASDVQFSMSGYVAWLRQAMQPATQHATNPARSSAPVYAFGYSMGGYVALAHEAVHPGTFAGIVTLGTKFIWTPESGLAAARRLDPAIISAKVPAFAATLSARHEAAGGWHGVLDGTRALLVELGDAPLLSAAMLGRVLSPVHVAVGSKDDTVDKAESCATARAIPRGSCSVLGGVPHPIERVPPADIVALVRRVLNPPTVETTG